MKKLFTLFLFITLFIHTAFTLNVRVDSMGRPLYAADRIKVKLSEDASEKLNLVLSEEGDYSDTGLNRLDNLFELINVSKITLAHRPVLDKIWEQENGFNRWYLLFVPIGTDIESAITDISSNEYIESVNPEYICYISATPNDTYFDDCWGHDNTSQLPSYNSISEIHDGPAVGTVGFDSHIEEAWDDTQGYGDSSIIIAILDTGVDYNHVDLNDNCVSGWDYGDGDSDPMDDSADEGHGTCCAGIAAGEVNNSIGVSGVAGDCSIMPLKISNSSGTLLGTAIINALTHCGDNDVDIASMSFGSTTDYGDSPDRDAAILYAYDHGVTLLACTHNYDNSSITNPANDPNVIAVGAASPCAERKDASSCDGEYWWGSNYGVDTQDARNAVDVIAPTMLPATDVTGGNGYSSGDYIMFFNGTSCSTPYAAGVAALIKSKDPSLTPAQIRGYLTSTATDVVDEEPTAGWDRYTGYGLVNADAAVGAVIVTNTWDGSFNRYWSQPANWSLNRVPTAGENVVIPAVGYIDPMYVDISDAECNDLTIASGVEFQVKDQTLTVNGNLSVSGHINMLEDTATITVMGDVVWESGSYITTTMNATYINVYGDWDFSAGANVNPTQGYINFYGTTDSWIRGYSTNSSFYRLRNYKSGGAKAIFSNLCTEDIVINDLVYTTSSSILESRSSHDIIMRGNFNYYGTFDFTVLSNTGSVIFDGAVQNINNYSSGSGIFNNIVFSPSTSVTLFGESITVAGDLTIEQGNFNPANYDVTVGGDWTNTVGTAGFTEGTGRVIFDGGNYHQYCSNETFNELEINKASGGAFRMDGTNVVCTAYDWTAGAIDVLSGSFTANGLLDNSISGAFYLNAGGTIDLYTPGNWVDLNGELHIFGGTMTVTGSISDWSYSNNALIEMTDGVLDFTECGISVVDYGFTLTEDITGGAIRTVGNFTGTRSDFNPTGGTIELYGSTDASLSMGTGSNFYNVLINKAASDEITKESKDEKRISYNRDGTVIELTRSNTVSAVSDLDINGDLQIDNGTFNLNGYNVDVSNDVHNYDLLIVAVDDTLNTGNDMYLYTGSVVDLSGVILIGTRPSYYGDAIHYSGSTFNQTDGHYYVETIHLYNGSQFNGTGGITHMYVNGSSSTNNIEIDDQDSYFYQFYIDSGCNAALYSCDYDLFVSHIANLYAPLDVNGFTLSTQYMNVKESGDLIINTNGVVNVRGNGPYIQSTGALTMTTGSELNSADNIQFQTGSIENVSGGEIFLAGSFTNADEIFTPTGGSVTFDGSSAESILGTTAFHDLNINKTGATVTADSPFSIHDLVINSGVLDPGGNNVEVSGNWTNSGGTFNPGTSTVIFDSSGDPQDVFGTNTFYNVNQVNNYEYLRFNDNTTILNDLELHYFCWAYDNFQVNGILNIDDTLSKFTANGSLAIVTIANLDQGGTLMCNSTATLTVNDLVEDGIYGKYYVNDPGGTLNLTNSGWVDLNGELHITGGTMNVSGSDSIWPYTHDALITMTDGILDLTSCRINIYNSASYTLTETITGGTIRTVGDFLGDRTDFNPTGGTIELYGTTDASLSMGAGSNFHNVLINKAVSDEITKESKVGNRKFYDRDGSVIELTRSNMIVAASELDINGNFAIDDGVFHTNIFDMSIAGNWTNNVGTTGFLEGIQTVTLDGSTFADILTDETFFNLTVNKTTTSFDGLEMVSGITINVLNDLAISDGTLEMNDYSTLNIENDVQINLDAGLNAGGADTGLNLFIGGNWTNDNTGYDIIYGYSPGGEIITFNGSADQFITTQAPQEDFGNLVIDKTGGEFRSNNNIRVIHDLDILAGCWHDNAGMLTHYLEGDLYITAGTAACWNSLTGNTVVFKGLSDQTVYNPIGYHYFRDIVIDKTAWTTRSSSNHEGTESTLSRQDNIDLSNDITETRAMTVTLNSSIDMEFGNGLIIDEGTLDLNGKTLQSMGDVIINDGGTLIVDEGAILKVKDGDLLTVNSGGTIEVLGTSGNLAAITHRSTGNYDFNIYPGGIISAEYSLFEYMSTNGVFVMDGGIVDPVHSFNYCTFQNGIVGYATLLLIDNADDVTIIGANFPDVSSSDYNVAKTIDHGTITMLDATGIFAGEAYELDDHLRIHWTSGVLPAIDDLTIQYNAGSNEIELNWTYPQPVDQYKIYRSSDPYDFSAADEFISYTESYSESVTGTNYFYQVTAENTTDNGISSKKGKLGKIQILGEIGR